MKAIVLISTHKFGVKLYASNYFKLFLWMLCSVRLYYFIRNLLELHSTLTIFAI